MRISVSPLPLTFPLKPTGRKHLKVSRQRKDFAIKTALCMDSES